MNNSNWIDREEYPFESHYFWVPAGNLHYVDERNGSPIVMVHGNPTWSFQYRKLIKPFRSEYRCIAMDHLGFGLSDKPRDWSYLPEGASGFLVGLPGENEEGATPCAAHPHHSGRQQPNGRPHALAKTTVPRQLPECL